MDHDMEIQDLQPQFQPVDHGHLSAPRADDRNHRFGPPERLPHWWIVAMFGAALLTSLVMGDEAESGSLLRLHIGFVMLIGIGIVLAPAIGDAMAVLQSAKDLLVFDRTDLSSVTRMVRHPGQTDHTRWGKFNIGQKVLACSLLASLVAIIVTGINSWSVGEGVSRPHAAAVAVALALLCAHVFMALINPTTRPAMPGMIFGHVRRSSPAKHHPAWLEDQDRKRPSQV